MPFKVGDRVRIIGTASELTRAGIATKHRGVTGTIVKDRQTSVTYWRYYMKADDGSGCHQGGYAYRVWAVGEPIIELAVRISADPIRTHTCL